MLIRCKRNDPPIDVTFKGGINYRFQLRGEPGEEDYISVPVCEVTNERHVRRFMEIPEGYEEYDPDENLEVDDGLVFADDEEIKDDDVLGDDDDEPELDLSDLDDGDMGDDELDDDMGDGEMPPELMSIDAQAMTNVEAFDFARSLSINARDPKDIQNYAKEMFGLELELNNDSPAVMIKLLVATMQKRKGLSVEHEQQREEDKLSKGSTYLERIEHDLAVNDYPPLAELNFEKTEAAQLYQFVADILEITVDPHKPDQAKGDLNTYSMTHLKVRLNKAFTVVNMIKRLVVHIQKFEE